MIAEVAQGYVHERKLRTAFMHHLLQFCVWTRIPPWSLQLQSSRTSGSWFWRREVSQKIDKLAVSLSSKLDFNGKLL